MPYVLFGIQIYLNKEYVQIGGFFSLVFLEKEEEMKLIFAYSENNTYDVLDNNLNVIYSHLHHPSDDKSCLFLVGMYITRISSKGI